MTKGIPGSYDYASCHPERVARGYGLCSMCYSRLWRKNNPDKVAAQNRKASLKRRYGMNEDEFEQRLAEQGGVCEICGLGNQADRRMAVDHDHATNLPRGLLCMNCNSGLGMLGDSVEMLTKAIAYLQRYKTDTVG